MIKSAHSMLLGKLIAESRQTLLEALATGMSHDLYLILSGKVNGLDLALQLSEQADAKLNGED